MVFFFSQNILLGFVFLLSRIIHDGFFLFSSDFFLFMLFTFLFLENWSANGFNALFMSPGFFLQLWEKLFISVLRLVLWDFFFLEYKAAFLWTCSWTFTMSDLCFLILLKFLGFGFNGFYAWFMFLLLYFIFWKFRLPLLLSLTLFYQWNYLWLL